MNTDGSTYSQAETESKSANFGSSATGTAKTYTGFGTGTCSTITIGANASSNIVECKYPRNQYTLTIDANGGTYSGSTSVTGYYEQEITLGSVTKTGYTHTWSITSGTGTVATNKFTFAASNATIKANWTVNKYTVTLNANGGYFGSSSVTTKTTTVTYNSTYGAGTLGSLPTPTRSGYAFQGWYTTSATSGGTKIENSTTVIITANKTYYARWKELGDIKVTLDAKGGSVSPSSIYVFSGGTYEGLPTPTKSKSFFSGWFTTSTPKGASFVQSTSTVKSNVSHTLYAYFVSCANKNSDMQFNSDLWFDAANASSTSDSKALRSILEEMNSKLANNCP